MEVKERGGAGGGGGPKKKFKKKKKENPRKLRNIRRIIYKQIIKNKKFLRKVILKTPGGYQIFLLRKGFVSIMKNPLFFHRKRDSKKRVKRLRRLIHFFLKHLLAFKLVNFVFSWDDN